MAIDDTRLPRRPGGVPPHLVRHPAYFAAPSRSRRRISWVVSYTLLFGVVALAIASSATALVAYIGLGAYAMLGRGHAVRALGLSWFLTMANPELVAPGSASVGRYAVLAGAMVSALLHGTILSPVRRGRLFIYATALLGLSIIVHALLFSQVLDVSILKAVSWTLAMCALLACWIGMPPDEREEVIDQLFWGLTLLTLFSLPLLFMPMGFLTNGTGFQGLLNQPQAFGTTMGLLAAWTGISLLGERRPSWMSILVFGISSALVLLSETRTAALGVMGGIGLSILLAPVLSGRTLRELFPGLMSARLWGVGVAVVVAGLIALPFVVDIIDSFLTKRGSGDSLVGAYQESRGVLIEPMLENVAEHPFSGIGFGVASDYMTMDVKRDSIIGLPMSAPIEKGLIFLGVLEELGVFLFALVMVWLVVFARVCARGGLMSFAVFLVIILFNFGEGTFFSPGGMGGLFSIFLTWAYAQGAGGSLKVRHG